MGWFSSSLLRLFYSGVQMSDNQAAVLKRLEPDAVRIYATKFQNYFEYLFFYTRYRQKGLPVPQLGFDYKIYLWQPISRLLKMVAARLSYVFRRLNFPDPYESGYFKDELFNGRTGFLSLVGKKSFHDRFLKSKTDPIHYLIEMQKETERPIYIIPHLMFFSKRPHRATPSLIDMLFGPEEKPGLIRRVVTLFKNPGRVFVEISEPVSLKHYLEAPEIKNQNTEYQSLMLRRDLLIQLNRHRQSITGPVLKSREELKESILTKDRFQEFMNNYSRARSIPIQEVRKKADLYLEEIAASYSPSLIRLASSAVGWIVRTMYDGVMVDTEGLNKVKSMALKGPLILIPCHKSHIDYLIFLTCSTIATCPARISQPARTCPFGRWDRFFGRAARSSSGAPSGRRAVCAGFCRIYSQTAGRRLQHRTVYRRRPQPHRKTSDAETGTAGHTAQRL